MRNQLRLLALAAAIASAACSAIVDPAAKDPMKSAQGYCNSIQDYWDRLAARCGGIDQAYADQLFTQLRAGCANVGTASTQGRIGYDRGIADQCIASLQAATCDVDVGSIFQFCALALPGQVAAGGVCTHSSGMISECAGNGTCYMASTCPGTCVAPGGVGDPCAPTGTACAAGLACDTSNHCVVPGGYGAVCGGANPPCNAAYYYCNSTSQCATLPSGDGTLCGATFGYRCYSGYSCVYNSVTLAYNCKAPAAHGADCSVTGYTCVSGDYCRYDSTIPGSRCWTIPTGPQPVGGDCYYSSGAACQVGLYCDSSQNYTCRPFTALGASCTSDGQCGPYGVCSKLSSATSGNCKTLRTNGTQCVAGAGECLKGLWCNGSGAGNPGVCRPLPGPGGGCGNLYYQAGPPVSSNEFVDCAIGSFCHRPSGAPTGTCYATVPIGGSCLVGGATDYSACGGFFTAAYCDTTVPAAPVCATNACAQPLGWSFF